MTMYSKHYNTRETAQSEAIPGREADMVENSAGGFSFAIDRWAQFDRFLILGTEGGTYYTTEAKLTKENASNVSKCIDEDGLRAIKTIVDISVSGRAPKNDAALFALAMCTASSDAATRKAALAALPQVARIGTHLFQFAEFVESFRGWGRGLRKAVAQWYVGKPTDKLQYQLVKYQSRYDWSHRDLLRLSHPAPVDDVRDAIFEFVTFNGSDDKDRVQRHESNRSRILENKDGQFDLLRAVEFVKSAEDAKTVVQMIQDYKLPREAIPTQFLNDVSVWEALLQDMPMTALVRNLGKLSSIGLLRQGNFEIVNKVVSQLTDTKRLQKARVHPIALLAALTTYKEGQGYRGSNTWNVVPDVVDALDDAFYKAFDFVEPTNKRHYLALDVSGSMGMYKCGGIPTLTAAMGAAAMSMVTYKIEPQTVVKGFANELREIDFSRKSRLDSVLKATRAMNFGMTDCAQPMLDALNNKLEIDTFVVYTDSETWVGKVHPMQALQQYRAKMNIPARLVVVGMTSTGFSIADPADTGTLDVVGFDTSTPSVISGFSAGSI